MTRSVYLCDPRHTYMGVLSSDAMPLGIGYMKAVMQRDHPWIEARAFVYPDDLVAALHDAPPDVLMLSNYAWNESLSLHLAALAKRERPDTLVVLGGPNFPIEADRQEAFLEAHPQVDVYVVGEGDFLAGEIVARLRAAGGDLAALLAEDLPSCVHRRDGRFVHGPVAPRTRRLDDIPSPWLTGVMDEFFDGRLVPMWETNRGCPFQCAFCVQGTSYYNKVTFFDHQRLREEIHHIGRMVRERSPAVTILRIADPNYGMYRRDPELSRYIGEVQARYHYPTYIDATTGKNRPDRIIESMEQVSGALVLYQAVQSLDEDVLANINRTSIKLEAYEALQVHLRGRGLRSSSDLIVGLPGETLASHLDSLRRMIDAGVSRLNNFQCMLLKGAELSSEQWRRRYRFETRFRVVPKSFGIYDGTPVFEAEEIVVSTATLSFDDYLVARTHHLACALFLNHGRMEILFRLAERHGIRRSRLFDAWVEAMGRERGPVAALVRRFLEETRGELFESPEAMARHYEDPRELRRLRQGEVGDNLIYKYGALAMLGPWREISRLAIEVTRRLLAQAGDFSERNGFDELWSDLETYQALRFACGATPESVSEDSRCELRFDVARWIDDGAPLDLERYRFARPRRFTFRLPEEQAEILAGAIRTFGLQQPGVSMLIKRIHPEHLQKSLLPDPGPHEPPASRGSPPSPRELPA